MELAGTTSWAMAIDEPQMLLLALYVRDASGIRPRTESAIPALDPPVRRVGVSSMRMDLLASQWEAWWLQLLEGGGFWPEHVNPRDIAQVRDEPDIQRLYYWPDRYAAADFRGLDSSPELQSQIRMHHEAALAWGVARKHEFMTLLTTRQRHQRESEVVRSIERRLGRASRPFKLEIRFLPVAGHYVWRVSRTSALISIEVYRDQVAYSKWLTDMVGELI